MKHFYFIVLLLFVSLNIYSQATDFVTGLSHPRDLIVYEGELYFTERDDHTISKVDLSLPNPVPVTVLSAVSEPYGLALNGNDLYFSHGPGVNSISKIDISQPNPTPTVVIDYIRYPIALALKGDYLYIAQFYDGKVSKIDITLSKPIIIEVADVNTPYALEFHGDDLYVAGYSSNKVSKIDTSSPNTSATSVITGLSLPVGLTLNGEDLYIAEAGRRINQDIISKINVTSSNPTATTVVTGLYNPISGLIVYNNILYISENYKISKFELPHLSTNNFDIENVLAYPNPTFDYVKMSGISSPEPYKIYSISGAVLEKGVVAQNKNIDVQHLSAGTYFLKLNDSRVVKFVKK